MVTILNTDDMIQAFYDFKGLIIKDMSFLNLKLWNNILDFLDGNNLTRNIDFIYKILRKEFEMIFDTLKKTIKYFLLQKSFLKVKYIMELYLDKK